MTVISSIGYEGTSLDAFVATLEAAGVTRLIEVRGFPSSCKAGFSKTPIRSALAVEGIGYEHWKALGASKGVRDACRASGDRYAIDATCRTGHVR